MKTTAPYGTWKSPIDANDAVAGLVGFTEVAYDSGDLFWLEMRPGEGGRQVLVRRPAATNGRGNPPMAKDLTPPPQHPRTLVHEYGGGALTVGHGKVVYSEFADQRLYELAETGARAVTEAPGRARSVRYADGRILAGNRMVCVRESHPEIGEAVNEIVIVELTTGDVSVLCTGRDFYSNPRPSRDGRMLAWLEWDHPNMPWDGTALKQARLDGSRLSDISLVAGGSDEAIYQPEWDERGRLVFISDKSQWWNVHRFDGNRVRHLLELDADFGEPLWQLGRSSFGFLSHERILVGFWQDGGHHLGVLNSDGSLDRLEDDLTSHARLVTDGQSTAWFIGAGPSTPSSLIELNVDAGSQMVVRANPRSVAAGYIGAPRVIDFPTHGPGDEQQSLAHGVYYPPANPEFEAPAGELPPLIVRVHGGPTLHVSPRMSSSFLYWTTRGFAIVDVNYRGSTAYGREYRNALRDGWGVVDVNDCIAAARYLAEQSEVDGDRLVITGGSAGGYTTLAALAFGDEFSAGASYYGVADVALLAAHTHKFESRYLDGLVGTDPDVMRARSPLYSADQITVPVILFQGLEDKVVPPEQSEAIVAALAANGVPHAYVSYPGEDHGFRKAANLVHSLESELAFYGTVFGFTPSGELPEVELAGS